MTCLTTNEVVGFLNGHLSEPQVEALFAILGGKEQEPTTGFAIYGATIEHEPDPLFADIEFEWDIDGRTGRFLVADVMGADIEPIRNPISGEPHFISIHPHDGFEFREAEMASANLWASEVLEHRHSKRFAAITYASYGPQGIIPGESLPARRS